MEIVHDERFNKFQLPNGNVLRPIRTEEGDYNIGEFSYKPNSVELELAHEHEVFLPKIGMLRSVCTALISSFESGFNHGNME